MGIFSKKSSSRANSVTSESTCKSNRKGSQTSLGSNARSPTGQQGRSSSSGNTSPALPSIPSIELPPAPDPGLDPSGYLRSIYAVRERSKFVIEAALRNQLTNFTVDMTKFKDVAEYVVSIIKVWGDSARHFLPLISPSMVARRRRFRKNKLANNST